MRIPRRPAAALCFSVLSSPRDAPSPPARLNPSPSPRKGYIRSVSGAAMEGAITEEKRSVTSTGGGDGFVWSSPGWGREVAMGKQIFCNRSLNMKGIVAVGFDMDYTLAQYMPETFESLAYNGTVRKLVYTLGYPSEVGGSAQKNSSMKGKLIYMGCYGRSVSGAAMEGAITEEKRSVTSTGGGDGFAWSSPGWGREVAMGKQIFCNRSLNMKSIVAVGFDMDYTLAQYMPETFESLAYNGTVRKLVYTLGYPSELLEWTFDWKYMVRGLVVDKKRGNILKMDRHKYVKVAYHGFKEISKEDKISTYGTTLIRDSFDEPDYALIDTLFSLAEAYLFAQLVDFKDNHPGKVPPCTDYSRMYKDVRAAVDLCHRDGTLKQMVAKDPKRYINENASILPMLRMLRASGRATFLVTNSLWDYTTVVMNFLCGTSLSDDCTPYKYDWLENFDVVITGSSKPSFFHEENRANLFEVEPESGMLLNTDNGILLPQIGSTSPRLPPKEFRRACRVFQGGNVAHLHKLLCIEASSQVLYVGDHIYGDILRSKKVLGWRTMLVVTELEKEVELLWETRGTRKELRQLRIERDLVEDKIHRLNWSLKFEELGVDEKQKLSSELHELELQREHVRSSHQLAQRECHQKFHQVWGQLMKTAYQNSRFAHQVERFACLYTSQVTNLSLYSPDRYYRPSEDFMPHEFDILAL